MYLRSASRPAQSAPPARVAACSVKPSRAQQSGLSKLGAFVVHCSAFGARAVPSAWTGWTGKLGPAAGGWPLASVASSVSVSPARSTPASSMPRLRRYLAIRLSVPPSTPATCLDDRCPSPEKVSDSASLASAPGLTGRYAPSRNTAWRCGFSFRSDEVRWTEMTAPPAALRPVRFLQDAHGTNCASRVNGPSVVPWLSTPTTMLSPFVIS
jgi:hypothetical protein